MCVYVCLKEREQKGCLVILSRSLAFIRDHHLLTTTTVQKRKKNPRRRNFLENVTFVLSSARVFKLRLTYVSFLRNESVMFAVLRQLHCVSTCDQIRVRGIYSSYQYLGMKTIERFASWNRDENITHWFILLPNWWDQLPMIALIFKLSINY